MPQRQLKHDKQLGKEKKLRTKAWLAEQRKTQVTGDVIKVTCTGNSILVHVDGPQGVKYLLVEPEWIEPASLLHPELKIREATTEEFNNWINSELNKSHFQGDAVVDEFRKHCIANFSLG